MKIVGALKYFHRTYNCIFFFLLSKSAFFWHSCFLNERSVCSDAVCLHCSLAWIYLYKNEFRLEIFVYFSHCLNNQERNFLTLPYCVFVFFIYGSWSRWQRKRMTDLFSSKPMRSHMGSFISVVGLVLQCIWHVSVIRRRKKNSLIILVVFITSAWCFLRRCCPRVHEMFRASI